MPRAVRDVDKGYKALARTINKMARKPRAVRVGVQGHDNYEPRDQFGTSNIELALVHEFGSRDGRVPQRSFIRSTIDRERPLIYRMLKRAAVEMAETGDDKGPMGRVGEVARAQMVRTIDESIGLKPNAPSTIDRKQRSTPLIETGQLKRSITWVIEK